MLYTINVATLLLTFLLFFLPFVLLPFAPLSGVFETPKVIVGEIAIELLVLAKIFQKNNSFIQQLNKQQVILTLGLIILTLIDLAIFQTPTSFFGNKFRLQGIFLLWHLLAFSIVSSTIKIDKIPSLIYPIFITLLLTTTIFLGGNENGRTIGTLGEPNALAATAIFILPFILFIQKNLIKILGFIVVLVIIFLSGSRSGLVAISMQSIFIVFNRGFKLSVFRSFIISLILFVLSLSLPIIEGGGWFENRAIIWQTAFFAGFNSPIIGNGFGNIDNALRQTSIVMNSLVQHEFVDSSHNLFLDFWVQGGIVGLIALIAIIFFSIKNLIHQSKMLELTLLLGLIGVLSFNPASVVTLVAFWWVVGQGFVKITLLNHTLLAPKDGSG